MLDPFHRRPVSCVRQGEHNMRVPNEQSEAGLNVSSNGRGKGGRVLPPLYLLHMSIRIQLHTDVDMSIVLHPGLVRRRVRARRNVHSIPRCDENTAKNTSTYIHTES